MSVSSSAKQATPTRAPRGGQLDPQRVGERLDARLRRAVGAEQRRVQRGHPGVGDHDVEAVQMLHGRFDRGLGLLPVAHVAHYGEGVAALSGGPSQLVGLDPREHELRSARVQPLGGRRADPASGRVIKMRRPAS
jgi:hypothetical protein